MKAHDKFFLTLMIATLAISAVTAVYVYPSSHSASYFALIFGSALTVAVRMDWIDFTKRHNL